MLYTVKFSCLFPFPCHSLKLPRPRLRESRAAEKRDTKIRATLGKFHLETVGKIFLTKMHQGFIRHPTEQKVRRDTKMIRV